jgi:hypothetical protein
MVIKITFFRFRNIGFGAIPSYDVLLYYVVYGSSFQKSKYGLVGEWKSPAYLTLVYLKDLGGMHCRVGFRIYLHYKLGTID